MSVIYLIILNFFFFFNDTATTEIYTLSLHDALPISNTVGPFQTHDVVRTASNEGTGDRKSTRLNSSHRTRSYAVFCLKKKNNNKQVARIVEEVVGELKRRGMA